MIGVREKKKQQTRKAIIDAAITLFAEQGYEQTSMDQLARAAGVGKATIYGYFKAKEEIFLAYCETEIDFAFSALDRKLNEEAPLVDQLVAQTMGQITFITANREFGRIFAREMLFPGANNRLSSRDLDMRYLNKVSAVLQRAQEHGELPAETDQLLLIAHFHALYMMVLSSFYRGDLHTLDAAEVFVRALILQTLHGPDAISRGRADDRNRWQELKQDFLEQRELEL